MIKPYVIIIPIKYPSGPYVVGKNLQGVIINRKQIYRVVL